MDSASARGSFKLLLITVLGLSAMALASCASGGEPLPVTSEPIPTVPAPTALPTSEPTETPVVVEDRITILPFEPTVDVETLTVPICRTSSSSSSSNGFGTVPHATATPLPGPSDSASAGEDFVAAITPLYDSLTALVIASNKTYEVQGRATSVTFEGRRLSHICSALSLVPVTGETAPIFSELARALKTRHEVLTETADLMRIQDAEIGHLDVERDATTTTILEFGSILEEFSTTAEVDSSIGAPGPTTASELLDVEVNVPRGWFVVRSGVDILISAPAEFQRYSVSGLGPDSSKQGTAIRIRRFRNEAGHTLDDVVAGLDNLLVRFGARTDQSSSHIGLEPGIQLTYTNDDGHWQTVVSAAVIADFTYLVELGCPTEFIDGCKVALPEFLAGVSLKSG